jgi:hypothetical protein
MKDKIVIPCWGGKHCSSADHRLEVLEMDGRYYLDIREDTYTQSISIPAWLYAAIEKAHREQSGGPTENDELHERLAKADVRIRELTEERDDLRERAEEFEVRWRTARSHIDALHFERNALRDALKERDAIIGDTPVRAFYTGKRAGYDEAFARLLEIEKEIADLKAKLAEAE